MTDETRLSVQSQFGRQARKYAASGVHRDSDGLAALLRLAAPSAGECALDVATGTGFTALALAPRCRRVVALDLTPQMVEQAQRLQRERGVVNVLFCLGDAEALPFRDGAFDIVTCRVAAHHFLDLRRALDEMARVTRSGGRVVVDDTCAPESPMMADVMNAWEKRRDPSHVANQPPSRLHKMLEDSGLRVKETRRTRIPLEFDDWVRLAGVPAPEVKTLRRDFMQASPAAREAFRIQVKGSAVLFAWDEIVMLGVKR